MRNRTLICFLILVFAVNFQVFCQLELHLSLPGNLLSKEKDTSNLNKQKSNGFIGVSISDSSEQSDSNSVKLLNISGKEELLDLMNVNKWFQKTGQNRNLIGNSPKSISGNSNHLFNLRDTTKNSKSVDNRESTSDNSDKLSDPEQPTGELDKVSIPGLPIFPSPDVTQMMKYSDFPNVDQFGCVPIDVPLFNINAKDISENIMLSYHSGGVKVDQEATVVGLGWNLHAGGSISRVVMDVADDELYYHEYAHEGARKLYEYGWLNKPDMIKQFPILAMPNDDYKNALYIHWSNTDMNVNAGIALNALYNTTNYANEKRYDLQPDIFYINLPTFRGKFIFGFDGLPKLIDSNTDILIEPFKEDPASSTRITKFILTDVNGFKYTFGSIFKEKSTIVTNYNASYYQIPTFPVYWSTYWTTQTSDGYELSREYTSVWFLEKIESPKNTIMNFSYQVQDRIQFDIPVPLCQTKSSIGTGISWNSIGYVYQKVKTCYLNHICYPGGMVDFTYSDTREDIPNGRYLQTMNISNRDATVHTISFGYEMMNANTTPKQERLILKTVTKDINDVFSFQYYDGSLPAKGSKQQDFWGYYAAHTTDLFPRIYVYPQQNGSDRYRCFRINTNQDYYMLDGSDRTVDETSILTGMLKWIKYPTSGKTIFEFEPNEYFDPLLAQNVKGGGVRIKRIIKKSEKDVVLLSKIYSFENNGISSGASVYDLAFATPTTYAPLQSVPDLKCSYLGEHLNDPPGTRYNEFTVRFTHNRFPSGNLDGYMVGYTHVTTQEVGNGKVTREYYPPRHSRSNPSPVSATPMNAWNLPLGDPNHEPGYYTAGFDNIYTKTCESYSSGNPPQTNYRYRYHSPFGSDYLEDVISCGGSTQENHVPSELHYYGGGGFFTPSNYSPYGYWAYLTEKYVFGVQQSNFKIYHTNYCQTELECQYSNVIMNYQYQTFDWQTTSMYNSVPTNGNSIFPFPPMSDLENDDLKYSKLISEKFYTEGSQNPCKIIVYTYVLKNNGFDRVFGMISEQPFLMPDYLYACPEDASLRNGFGIGFDYFLSGVYGKYVHQKSYAKFYYNTNCTAVLDHMIETDVLNGNSITKTTSYNYTSHYLLSSVVEQNSDNTNYKNEFKYVFNFPTGIYSDMNAKRIFVPIQILRFNNDLVTNGSLFTYKYDDNIIVQDKIYNIYTKIPLQASVCDFDGSSPNSSYWDEKVSFDEYENGNLTQYHLKNNILTSFIWGYDYTTPVAKIDGASYATVEGALNTSISALQNKTDAELRAIFSNLRIGLPNARVYSYTYLLPVGFSSESDVNDKTNYFDYDAMTRLKAIKDQDLYIKKYFEYHYYQ